MKKDEILELLTFSALLFEKNELKTAGYYASAAFEAILPKQKIKLSDRGFYENRIRTFCTENGYGSSHQSSLETCRVIRNNIIHDDNLYRLEELINEMCFLIGKSRGQIIYGLDDEDFRRLRKKFTLAKESSSSSILGQLFDSFRDEDFRNLNEMRNAMGYLKENLTPFCQSLRPKLEFDTISDTLSAYVWLAAVRSLESDRPKIDQPSLSVLATNQDLRVYLDFGGRCKVERKKYYDLLFKKKLDDLLQNLGPEFRIFDVYWYFNLENIRTIQKFAEAREFWSLIDRNVTSEIDSFNDYISKSKTVPENKFLVGRIFPKNEVVEKGKYIVDDIKECIMKLHPILHCITK